MTEINDSVRAKVYRGELEFSIEERTPEHVVSRMPIRPGILNPFGTVHAGAMLWFADVTATVLALGDTQLGPQGQGFPLAIDLHSTLLANRREGELKAEAKFVRRGKRVMVVRTQVSDGEGNVLVEVTTTHIPA